jgi:hypothetical protein
MRAATIYILLGISMLFRIDPVHAQQKQVPVVCISEAEEDLYKLVNAYRKRKGLSELPLSKSLTYVAQLHVNDLSVNHPYGRKCNLHSWSGNGPWTSCCYSEDHARAECMWNKPRELTNYTGDGYEIAYWTDEPLSPDRYAKKALAAWQKSSDHNPVIINSGKWSKVQWKTMGVGIYNGYAAIWFGREEDDGGHVEICTE